MNIINFVAGQVRNLQPGTAICVPRTTLDCAKSVPMLGPLGPIWSPVDQVMEKVVGSAHSIRVTENPMTRDVTFYRLPDGMAGKVRTYISPDRRHLYKQQFDGTYTPI